MGSKVSVGPPYFNLVNGPIALLLVTMMAAGPLLRWRRDRLAALGRRLALPADSGVSDFLRQLQQAGAGGVTT